MHDRRLVPIVCLLLACGSSALAQPQAQTKPLAYPGDPAHGQQLVDAVGCWECHGHLGQGGIGPRLAPGPLPLQGFAAYVRSPAREMPPYPATVLSAKDIVDIHAFLASIPPPPAVPTASLPP